MANFPTSPSNGDFFTNELGVIYQYVASGNYWKIVSGALTNVITPTITDGDTTHAPNGNAVYDALALKQTTANLETSALDTSTTKYPCNNVVKTAVDLKLATSGGTLTGDLTLGTNKILYFRNINTYLQSVSDYILKLYSGDSIALDSPNIYISKNNAPIRARNAANSADHEILKYDSSNILQLGAEAASINMNSKVVAGVANGSAANDAVNKGQLDAKAIGASSSTANNLVKFSGTDGKTLADSGKAIVTTFDATSDAKISTDKSTYTEFAKHLMIGSGNSAWIPMIFENSTASVGNSGTCIVIAATSYPCWSLALPTNRGGLKLKITGFRYRVAGSAGNYVGYAYLYGINSGRSAAIISITDDNYGPAQYSGSCSAFDCSSYDKIAAELQIVYTNSEIQIRSVEVQCYYE